MGIRDGPWRVAVAVAVPYLFLMISWALSNPPGAAPDEPSHLTKALGVAHLDIGTQYRPDRLPRSRVALRNVSISRVVTIPANLDPEGYDCTAQHPKGTANCQPDSAARGQRLGQVKAVTAVGSYLPVWYLPMGLAASAAGNPAQAFRAARAICVTEAVLLLLLGVQHLARWLGQQALLGVFVGLTPTAIFASSMVSTSGVEIFGSFALASFAIVAIRRPESIFSPGSQLLFTFSSLALILSRQLGIVTWSALVLFVLIRLGWRFWRSGIRHLGGFGIASLVIVAGAICFDIYWERAFDHPALTGSAFDVKGNAAFATQAWSILETGIARFGWLDTQPPRWSVFMWMVVAVTLIGVAVLLGSLVDRWSLTAWLVATVLVAYVVYVTVFYPIQAGLQGRHVLPFFLLCPLLSGVVVAELLTGELGGAGRRLFTIVAATASIFQAVSLYWNARRYAVGVDGPLWFLGSSEWRPAFGWIPWLILGVIGSIGVGYVAFSCRPPRMDAIPQPQTVAM
jgi:hypothetical protein